MTTSQILPAAKQMIAEGNIELALTRLIELLESDPQYMELLQIARVNQADVYQNKAALLKGTISTEDSRLVLNQVTDSAYQIINQIETGNFLPMGREEKPTRSQAWRYYVAGGIVALAAGIIIWRVLGGSFSKSTDNGVNGCPNFGSTYKWKVMILPFKKTGATTNDDPQYDISDGLNKLIQQTPGMNTQIIADINEKYDINLNYPNPSEAADIARNCDAQMIVWGKINLGAAGYKLDVFYKLLDAGGVRMTGDTTINSLLQIKEDGQLKLVADVNAIVRLLYVVLANQSRMPIAANLLKEDATSKMGALSETPADTAIALALADNLVQTGNKDQAIKVYDQVLETYPAQHEARQKRGALLYEKGDYAAAARDLEVAAPEGQKVDPSVLRIRVEASLKSGQPDKAGDDLKRLKNSKNYDGTWFRKKDKEVSDSLVSMRASRDRKEQMANRQPQNTRAQLAAGRANIAVGDSDRAIKNADKALKTNPKNAEAYEIKIMASAGKGDTAQVRKEIETARREGVNVKGLLDKLPPTVKLLLGEKRQ